MARPRVLTVDSRLFVAVRHAVFQRAGPQSLSLLRHDVHGVATLGVKSIKRRAREHSLSTTLIQIQFLGLELEEAAFGIIQILTAQMADLVRKTTIDRGYDPADFVLFSFVAF